MASRRYDALLLDHDGTLLDHEGRVNPRNLAALREAERAGVRVVVATGRSSLGAREVIDELGLRSPTALFNGAAIWCPSAGRLIEERVVANRTLARALEYGAALDLLTVVMCADRKLSIEPRSNDEATALGLLSRSAQQFPCVKCCRHDPWARRGSLSAYWGRASQGGTPLAPTRRLDTSQLLRAAPLSTTAAAV
jgi:hydroxymethylpyrimidine pyrophosphatase-like HAD family hydrolase